MIKNLRKIVYGKEYKDELDNKILNNKILWFMIMVMIFWNSMLSIGYMDVKKNNQVKATFAPYEFNNKEQVVGNDFADDNHFLSWAMFLITTTSNFDTQNIKEKFDTLANSMLLDDYVAKKENIDAFVENIKRNKIKSKFIAFSDTWKVVNKEENQHNVEAVTINVQGEVANRVSTYEPIRKNCDYSITLFRKGGDTYVQDFTTTCF